MDNKYIIHQLEDKVKTNITKNNSKIQTTIKKYIDRNNDVIFDIGPIKRLLFLESDKEALFELTGTSHKELIDVIKNCSYIESGWQISGNTFNILAVVAIRDLAIKKQRKETEAMILYLTLAMYSSVHYKYFPKGEPNANIMTYTINNLSNKYLIKQEGSLFKALYKTAMKSHQTYLDELLEGTDEEIVKYLNNLRIRLSNLIKNIASEFYKNHEEGNYYNREQDNFEEENYHIADNSSFAINRIAEAATMRFISRGIDNTLAKKVANMNNVSINAIRNALNDLLNKKGKEVKSMFVSILQLYLSNGSKTVESIRGLDFIIFSMSLYSKSNTNDESINNIKNLLDAWLKECSPQYRNTERLATLSAYRKAIYTYFVFLLSESSKSV